MPVQNVRGCGRLQGRRGGTGVCTSSRKAVGQDRGGRDPGKGISLLTLVEKRQERRYFFQLRN